MIEMRSLTLKLTLAFLLVGVVGVLLFGFVLGQRTRTEFDQFISTRDHILFIEELSDFYDTHGEWSDVGTYIMSSPQLGFYSRDAILTDARGIVIIGKGSHRNGTSLPKELMVVSSPIKSKGDIVGYVHFGKPGGGPQGSGRPSRVDAALFERLTSATFMAGGLAALIALLIGGLLARTLTKSLRELTVATKAMAGGHLGQQVEVRSNDEVGELALAFNQMSSDLAKSTQARKQMTADLAHDIRTPLSILRGYTQGLKEGQIDSSTKVFDIMHGEVEHLQHLVEDLRTLSLADTSELSLNKRAVDPKALLERAALAHMMQAENQGVTLRVEANDDLPSISVDTDRIAQVLNNLVSNALRHTTQGEVVLLAAHKEKQSEIKVRDTGIGIASEDLPFVFDRFYRADKARQRANDDDASSGLGLAIAKAIVEAHGGTLSVESKVGEGATFTILIPDRQIK
jgi:two-component system sensor histidine kinase BaeS